MDSLKILKYKSIEELFNEGVRLISFVKKQYPKASKKELVLLARKILDKNLLNKYYYIGNFSFGQLKLFNTKTNKIFFSLDNIIKNLINHPEINIANYKNIPNILQNPDKTALSKVNTYSIILFKKDKEYYQIVIKTTKNREENFLTSFRKLGEKEFNKY